MSVRRTFATALRVLRQLRHDPRTVGLIMIVPSALIIILKYAFQSQPAEFNSFAPMLLGIFPLFMVFLATSITTLHERTSGTLERLMTGPMSKADLMFGYALAFSLIGLLQACLTGFVTLGLLGITVMGGTFLVLLSAILAAFLGTSLGLFVSAFATSEAQAVELVMPIMLPQALLCGLFIARSDMARVLRWVSDVLPLTYSVDAMKQVTVHTGWPGALTRDLLIVFGFAIAALILGSLTIRRQE
jgi:ABC-2 type transport system permease protein